MTATMSKATLESTLEGLVRLHWSQQVMGLSHTKAEVAASYWQRGIREGIAAILFKHRGDSLPRCKTIPMIYESDVNGILRDEENDFVHGGPDEKKDALMTILSKLMELAVPVDLLEHDEELRREYVLHGTEKARPEDIEWIAELADAKRREMQELVDLLSPIGFENVNHTPDKAPRSEPVCSGGCGIKLSTFDEKAFYERHLSHVHFKSPSESKQHAVAGWSRLQTYLQANERITASGEGIITTSPTLGDALSQVIGAVRGADTTATRVLKDNPQA